MKKEDIHYSLEAEQGVLGALMIESDNLFEIVEILKSKMFYGQSNRKIFKAIEDLYASGEKIDLLTISEKLKCQGELDSVGGRSFLSTLTEHSPMAHNAKEYARIVLDAYLRRQEIQLGRFIISSASQSENNFEERHSELNNKSLELLHYSGSKRLEELRVGLANALERIEAQKVKNKSILGLSTGFHSLDAISSGFQSSNLIILAARPGAGKTSLACNIGVNVAKVEKKPVIIFSMEMISEQINYRLMSSEARVNLNRLMRGNLSDSEERAVEVVANELSELPIHICPESSLTVQQIKLECQKYLRRYHDLGLVIVDYLQLIKPASQKDNRANQVAEISRQLKLMANDLNVPVLAIATLSRQVEARDNKRPQLSDLKESGAIEYDADLVLFVYRDDYYNQDSESNGEAEILVAKNRSGPTGKFNLIFKPEFCRFDNKHSLYT